MIKLLQRIRKGEIELCCVGKDGTHIWVNIYDVINYLEDEMKMKEVKDERNSGKSG